MKTKKRTVKNILIACMLILVMGIVGVAPKADIFAATSTKKIVIWSLKGTDLKYYKASWSDEIGLDWSTQIVGSGKQKKIKLAKNATFYLISFDDKGNTKNKKVSKKTFCKKLNKYYKAEKCKEGKISYVTGMACKITIKKGKVVKVVQIYQP